MNVQPQFPHLAVVRLLLHLLASLANKTTVIVRKQNMHGLRAGHETSGFTSVMKMSGLPVVMERSVVQCALKSAVSVSIVLLRVNFNSRRTGPAAELVRMEITRTNS